MTRKWHIPRRTFLKGLGTAIAVPILDTMMVPLKLSAANTPTFPKRMAFVYIPNGANMEDWTPKTVGPNYELPYILKPLKSVQKDLTVLSGLALDSGRAHGDGTGDHARANATFLTGCHPRKTAGADIKAGVSADQIAAEKIGHQTRFASLEVGCEGNSKAGNCDSNYSCAYQSNISWKTESMPMPCEIDPRLVFERLFSNNSSGEILENRARRQRYRKSILDFVLEDAKQLKTNLGITDQRKLDEYVTAVRETEQRIEKAERFAAATPEFDRPTGIPGGADGFEKHIRLMYDLQALAFQTDTTRISTFMIAFDGSDRSYPSIGVSDGHHTLSHHGNDQEKKKKIAKINHFHASQFAYFLEKLKSIKEGKGTLLDNCMIVYGSGIGDGNAHNHDHLPILLAGNGGGFTAGRHVKFEKETPLMNLFVSMLDAAGAPVERIGDSTGKLRELG